MKSIMVHGREGKPYCAETYQKR